MDTHRISISTHPDSRYRLIGLPNLVVLQFGYIAGEGSASTMWDNDDWALLPENFGLAEPLVLVSTHIHHITPQAKIIAILRNPVDRLLYLIMTFL